MALSKNTAGTENSNKRGAGILMHITSLPSPYGIGDIGPAALRFADFLKRSKQKYWQLLPLNPTGSSQGYSPYSSTASMAMNPMLISLEDLRVQGLLTGRNLERARNEMKGNSSFRDTERIKARLLNKAYIKFERNREFGDFEKFVAREAYWLNDFSYFILLKSLHAERPWYRWPQAYKKRNKKALVRLSNEYAPLIRKIKWQQYAFHDQWQRLRSHCKKSDIFLVGDVPFYVGHDSADVWANQDIFALDPEGNMRHVAGVPPDYFNSDGQLWGMPVFDWKQLKSSGYRWWLQRLQKNMALFDLVRLDHFRAFADFWKVDAGQKTARNGVWSSGPGKDFFQHVKQKFPSMPFIAEDLGDIDDAVYTLRDSYQLPGMKVLQFAFDDPGKSPYSPHNHAENFIVYTGTHDNNTTVGWYRKDLDRKQRALLSAYTGKKITERNVSSELIRLAYASVSKIAVIPMQDILGLDESARMNTPASIDSNWLWRMRPGKISREIEDRLARWMELYNRV
jgi:4-alpha-glucanotransferase